MRSWIKRSIGTTLVAAAVGVGAVTVFDRSSTPSVGPETAHIWINTTAGGSPQRNSSPATYDSTKAYSSWDAACDAASAGDTIRIKAGSGQYGQHNVSCAPASTVTMIGETGVQIAQLNLNTTTNLTLKDFDARDPSWTCSSGSSCSSSYHAQGNNSAKLVNIDNSSNVTFENVEVDRTYDWGDGVGFHGNNQSITWRDFHVHACRECKLIQIQSFPGSPIKWNDSLVFEDGMVEDIVYNATSYPGGQEPHNECWWWAAIRGITIDRVTTRLCTATGNLLASGSGQTIDDMVIRNSIFECKYGYATNAIDVLPGSEVGYRDQTCSGQTIDGDSTPGTNGDLTVEYSLIGGGNQDAGWTSITYRGNIMYYVQFGCRGFATYLYNRTTDADCSASDVQDSGALSSARYINGNNPGNWRPANGSVAQVNAGDPGNCPAVDADNFARPIGGVCDQGPYEFGAG
jgi:hypothetical protein